MSNSLATNSSENCPASKPHKPSPNFVMDFLCCHGCQPDDGGSDSNQTVRLGCGENGEFFRNGSSGYYQATVNQLTAATVPHDGGKSKTAPHSK